MHIRNHRSKIHMKHRLCMQSFIIIGQGNLEIQSYIFDLDDSLCLVLYLTVLHHLLGSTVVLEWKQFLLRLLGCTRKTHKSEMCLDVVQLNFRCLNIKDARAKRASIKNQIFISKKSNQTIK